MLGVGLYGDNGHQVHHLLFTCPRARLIGVSAFMGETPAEGKVYETLEEMLSDRAVDLISLCSPLRSEQADHAIACMKAGKHVYAEKPCALNEEDLDRILTTSRETGMIFREMAGTAFEEPYSSMREIVVSGKIGEIVQVLFQKSYPYHPKRPQDERVDGGLLLQAGIHGLRLIEHTAGVRITDIKALETQYGNPETTGGLRMAASVMMTLDNGGIAAGIMNYLNQYGHGEWGNDHLRIFGTKGFVESTDGGRRARLIVGREQGIEVEMKKTPVSYFDLLVQTLLGEGEMPLTPEDELHPLRMAIRAKRYAEAVGNG